MTETVPHPRTPGQIALMACVAEVCAPKAGNVHPQARFDDVTWQDFMTGALAIEPVLDRASELGVGETVLECVRATRAAIGTNANLGIVLLLAPLCAVEADEPLRAGVRRVLAELDQSDADAVYEAIRHAQPGGLGHVERGDVLDGPALPLLEAMRLASDRDAVARQYATDFDDVFTFVAPRLIARCATGEPVDQAVVGVHLEQMAREPDSLIVRKCGLEVGLEAQRRAMAVLDADWPRHDTARRRFDELDAWLRADGNRRNPGTSADLITAGLFVALRDGAIKIPMSWHGCMRPD